MKRTLLSLSLLAPAVLAFGQRTWSHAEHVTGPVFGSDRGTDTIVTAGIAGGTLTVYTAASGFVVGNNNYEDKAKAQQFDLGGEAVVDELLFLFGGKVAGSGNANSKIVAKVWALDGTGTASGGDAAAPGTELATADINIADVDTSGITGAPLGPVTINGSFAVGFDLTTLAAGDSVGLVSTQDGDGNGDSAWELWSDDTWYTFMAPTGWGLDIELFVAVVLTPVVGMEEASLNGMKMTFQNGNMVDDHLNVIFSLEKAADASLRVHDATGRQVINERLGNRSAGTHNLSLDMDGLGAGQYYVTLVTNGTGLSKKVVKR